MPALSNYLKKFKQNELRRHIEGIVKETKKKS